MTKCYHIGNMYNSGKRHLILTLMDSGVKICVLWEKQRDPPVQSWWNTGEEQWTTVEELLK